MLVKVKEVINPMALARICEKLGLNPEALLEPMGSMRANALAARLNEFEYRICGTDSKLVVHRDRCGAQLFRRAYSD